MKIEQFVVHYTPAKRLRPKNTIICRKYDDPMIECEKQVNLIYDKASKLLNTVKVWKENSFEDDLNQGMIGAFKKAIYKTLSSIDKEVNSLIEEYQIEDANDRMELLDAVTQLYEQANELLGEMEVWLWKDM